MIDIACLQKVHYVFWREIGHLQPAEGPIKLGWAQQSIVIAAHTHTIQPPNLSHREIMTHLLRPSLHNTPVERHKGLPLFHSSLRESLTHEHSLRT
jgi:hypothetical protein